MPAKVKEVREVAYVDRQLVPRGKKKPNNQLLAVVCQDGIVRFVDTNTCKLVKQVTNHVPNDFTIHQSRAK